MSQHSETTPTTASNINAEVLTTTLNNVVAPKSVSVFNAGLYKSLREIDSAARSWWFSVRRQLTHQTKITKEVSKISWCIDHLESNARDIAETHFSAQSFVRLADFEEWFKELYLLSEEARRCSVFEKLNNINSSDINVVVKDIKELWELNKVHYSKVPEDEFILCLLSCVKNQFWQTHLKAHTTFEKEGMWTTASALASSSNYTSVIIARSEEDGSKCGNDQNSFNGNRNGYGKKRNFGKPESYGPRNRDYEKQWF